MDYAILISQKQVVLRKYCDSLIFNNMEKLFTYILILQTKMGVISLTKLQIEQIRWNNHISSIATEYFIKSHNKDNINKLEKFEGTIFNLTELYLKRSHEYGNITTDTYSL